MKECKYCRTTYDDSLSACPSCGGTKIITPQEKAEAVALYQKEIENRENAVAVVATKRKLVISILVGIVVLIVAVIAMLSYNANKPLSNGMTKDEGEAILAEGIAFFNAGDYESAIECFVQLPTDSKQYKKAQDKLAKCEEEYSAIVVEKANGYAAGGDYEVALNLLKNAGELLPDNVAISSAHDTVFAEYKSAVCSNALSEADAFASNGDYPSVITLIDNAVALIGQDDELLAKRKGYVDTYVSQTVSSAKAQYIKYDYNSIMEAEKIIQTALNLLPDNEILLSELSAYKEREPIRIISMPAASQGFTSGKFGVINNVKDNVGNYYNDAIYVEEFAYSATDDNGKWWLYCYKTIDLDYQYSKITGKFFQNNTYKTASTKTKLVINAYKNEDLDDIYADYIIYEKTLKGNSSPVSFDVGVEGKKYIRLNFLGDANSGEEDEAYNYAYMSELFLWK